jgi:stearoyl-CoA desaturase (delta-9 desaturase)
MTEILYTLILTHITILCVTIYLHRGVTHRGLEFHPALSHFMRFWLWLTTGMVTKQWVAIHRKHHRFIDTDGDPHSPKLFGIKNIVFRGVYYYYQAAKDARMVVEYGAGTPNDWVERKVYTKHHFLGVLLMLSINVLLFGWIGILIWLAQIVWIPFWAAGVINGLGHWWGYSNTDNKDSSRNILPFGIWIGGEELHNNHHAEPANPRLSRKWWEIDIGWIWINIFKHLRLLRIR